VTPVHGTLRLMPERRHPLREQCGFTSGPRKSNLKVRVAAVAARQFGRIRYDQIRAAGAGEATIHRWCKGGYLHLMLPRVYAVGHPGSSVEADLCAAVLYAGPGAMLCHGTAIWWLELLKYPPRNQIHVSTPRDVKSLDGIVVHERRRRLERIWHKGLPVTTPAQALLDYAATGTSELLRLALANADYNDLLDVDAMLRLTGRGTAGSTALRRALQIHLPQLADTRSRGERTLLIVVCEGRNLPIPDVNVYVEGWLVDAHWPGTRLIVEIDRAQGHGTQAQIERDRRRDLELRTAGYTVLRYTERQLLQQPAVIAAEIRSHL
jgi:very-short-patch-repair endonuclease